MLETPGASRESDLNADRARLVGRERDRQVPGWIAPARPSAAENLDWVFGVIREANLKRSQLADAAVTLEAIRLVILS